jgi:diacylglycerol kinase family enzyme
MRQARPAVSTTPCWGLFYEVDDRPPEHFAVMAGVGVDAMIMDETDENQKDKVGSAAYFVAAAKTPGRLPMPVRVQLDDH